MKVYVMETHGGSVYLNLRQLAAEYGDVNIRTVKRRVKEMRQEIGKRYSRQAIVEDGNTVLVNIYAYLDFIQNRKVLKDENARKSLMPFHASEWVEAMGYESKGIRKARMDEC